MMRSECPYRLTNIVGQSLCNISIEYLNSTKCCQQICDETCARMRNEELKWNYFFEQAEMQKG